ncbi:MAG: C40 family peptidase [Lachnospiraceae bacterium]|nr:C40 family peptidase [Lachnospiraceae bacterium]
MMKIWKKAGALLLTGALLQGLISCGSAASPVETLVFQEISETEPTTEAEETSRAVTIPEPEKATIPTLEEEPFSPELELKFYTNFGLISDEIRIGNLRDKPSTATGNIVGRFYSNTGMEILEVRDDGWYRVSSGGLEGYVYQPLVKTGEDAIRQCMQYENYWVTVDSAALNVRMEPSMEAGILTRIRQGQYYRIVGKADGWFRITIGSEEGYIAEEYCRAGFTVPEAENWSQMDNIQGPAKNVIEWGMQYLGTPYVFGGNSMAGLDCSYFSLACMRQAGVSLPRLSIEQSQRGALVGSFYDAVPGDLFFYNSHGRGVDHVAIYIGDNKILHASQSIGCVSISVYNYCGEPVVIRRFY